MIQDTQEYLQHWEKENNPFYPNEMRWDRLKINIFLKDYKEQLILPDVNDTFEIDTTALSKINRVEFITLLNSGVKIKNAPDLKSFMAKGFLKGEKVRECQFNKSESLIHFFEGLKLDEVQMNATIKSRDDVDNLISFLKSTKECFV